ncbi:MAG: hypothetical protein LQ350_005757 [Teloschistes chrysophthalmus]|nr:MAG: hypothetical protein LQ350_005757 [Niorma chrysophthalma]
MPSNASRRTAEEQAAANSQALRGGIVGAAKFGSLALALAIAGTFLSPLYRSLTIQFKVYLQLSGMTLGGWIEADRRLRRYEWEVLTRRRRERWGEDERVWARWERLVEEEGGVGGKGKGKGGGKEKGGERGEGDEEV